MSYRVEGSEGTSFWSQWKWPFLCIGAIFGIVVVVPLVWSMTQSTYSWLRNTIWIGLVWESCFCNTVGLPFWWLSNRSEPHSPFPPSIVLLLFVLMVIIIALNTKEWIDVQRRVPSLYFTFWILGILAKYM